MTNATNRPVEPDDLFADAPASAERSEPPADRTPDVEADDSDSHLPHDGIEAAPRDDVEDPDGAGPGSAEGDPAGDDAEAEPADDTEADPAGAETADAPIDWEARAEDDGRTPAQLLEALMTAEVERDDFLDQLRRKQAEFDNFRKRMARDAQRQRQVGKEAVAQAMLDVLDDFDRTVAALEADDASRKGIELVRDKLVLALKGQGLERMEAAGAPFDPTLHEAVQQVPGEDGEPTVSEVLRHGWTMHDRVLRPAMVVVAQ